MNANKQDAGGLPNEMGFEQWYAMNAFDYPNNPIGCRDCSIARKAWHAALEAVRNGELCRAAPAGGDVERDADFYSAGYANGYKHATKDSAPAGGDELAKRYARDMEDTLGKIAEAVGLNPREPDADKLIAAVKRVSAPAGGDEVKCSCVNSDIADGAIELLDSVIDQIDSNDYQGGISLALYNDITGFLGNPKVSAPAGSGEVEDIAVSLEQMAGFRWTLMGETLDEDCTTVLHQAAALLRKLQQGADGCQHDWRPDADVMNARYCPKCDVTQTLPRKESK